MTPDQSPFPPGWMGTDLPGHRACDSTYCFYDYGTLPPLDESLFRGEFQWLPPLEPRLQPIVEIHRQTPPDKLKTRLDHLLVVAEQMRLTLPTSFLTFMRDPERRDQIPSSTACYFDLPGKIVKNPVGEGYLIRFLNDQQDVLFWYLYLTEHGEHGVVVSNLPYDTEDVSGYPPESVRNASAFCAPSFEAFLYRYWMENTLWFGAEGGGELTEAQQRYLKHYVG